VPEDLVTAPAHVPVGRDSIARGGAFVTTREYRIAPGLDLVSFSRLEEEGWNNGHVLVADLTETTLSMDVVDSGQVASVAGPDELARVGTDAQCAVAAVNGTFFDMDRSGAPVHTSMSSQGIRMGTRESRPALTVTDGKALIEALAVSGTLTVPRGGPHDICGINRPSLEPDGLGVFTDAWGDMPLDRVLAPGDDAPARIAARATVVGGRVTAVEMIENGRVGSVSVPAGGHVLVGRESGARILGSLRTGDRVGLQLGPDHDVDLGLAGSHQVLVAGNVPELGDDEVVTSLHARTVLGLSKDGRRLFVLVVDGGSSDSHGMDLVRAGRTMRDLGAHDALNLDGGGSSALAARVAGTEGLAIRNKPSDGTVRAVANALVFSSHADHEEPVGVQIGLASAGEEAVLPGTHRTLTATGLAADLSPVATDGFFTASGTVELTQSGAGRAVVLAGHPGPGTVVHRAGPYEDRITLRVLGAGVRLEPDARVLHIADPHTRASLGLMGLDADGRTARIETQDATASVSDGFTVREDGLCTWKVTATGAAATGTLTFRVGELQAEVTVTVGTERTDVLDFSDPSAFHDEADRATGTFEATDGLGGRDGRHEPAIAMTYDFTTSVATRGYYLVPEDEVVVDGTTLAFTADIRSDGNGSWPRLQVADGKGTVTNLDGDPLTSEGWQTVRFPVPDGLAQPLTVQRIRMIETRPEAQYFADVAITNLQAITAPAADGPDRSPVPDPALLAIGDVEDRARHVAVMSDAQFVARDPDGAAARGARRTLREIAAHDPDLLVIDGDFVDEAAPEDFALARQILDEEWDPSIPCIYVPGNHEVMGGRITNFRDVFGDVTHEMTLDRTRIITLDSSSGTLAGGGIAQLDHLLEELERVAASDTCTGAVVFLHHPTRDPLPDKNSRLTDRREAAALENVLARFRRESGKSVAMVNGHVGVFHGAAIEGVTSVINGNAGKDPHGTAGTGGFVGWTMLGIDPDAGVVGTNPSTRDRVDWLAAETHPWVDGLVLEATADLPVGGSGGARATIHQDDREIPVAWPVTSQWGGDGVEVDLRAARDGGMPGDTGVPVATGGVGAEEDKCSAVVRVVPSTGELTGLRPGTAHLTVTVNGAGTSAIVTVG
jgi:3',5'-cyclic AMP phosphodiesterase CpdA